MVPAFLLADLVVVHLQFRRESQSVSFREVPLVIGLVFLPPVALLAASLIGVGLALLRRRGGTEKFVFNLSLLSLEASLAALLYHLALGGGDPTGLRGVLAALATLVVADLVTAAAVTVVIWLKVGEFDDGVLSDAVTSGLVAALTNTSLGLLVVVLLESRPFALVLLVGVLVTVALAYRGYSALDRSHARLESLYRFTRGVQEQLGTVEVSDAVLRQARDILAAQSAELVVLPAATAAGRGCACSWPATSWCAVRCGSRRGSTRPCGAPLSCATATTTTGPGTPSRRRCSSTVPSTPSSSSPTDRTTWARSRPRTSACSVLWPTTPRCSCRSPGCSTACARRPTGRSTSPCTTG
jgi:hypothetical protein